MEKPSSVAIVQSHLRNHSITASGLAHDCHVIWIATEGSDVGLHPLQCEALIQETCIA